MTCDQQHAVADLRRHVEATERNEQKCGECLACIARILLPFPLPFLDGPTISKVDQELRTSAGDLDLVVIGEWAQAGLKRREAYVWELKAPQLPLFQWDTHNRAIPTKELLSAENQLLHYHYEFATSGSLRRRFSIMSRDDVHLGGIVMGRDHRLIEPHAGEDYDDLVALAHRCREVRETHFYRKVIKLWTWDNVLRIAEMPIVSHGRYLAASGPDVTG